jgi:hypothetical protein
MKKRLATILLLVVALFVATFSVSTTTTPAAKAAVAPWDLNAYGPRSTDNVVLKWNDILLQAISKHPAQTGPTIVARMLGMLHTATYDAWAAYDAKAKSTTFGSTLRRPVGERTFENKSKAISYAAFRVLTDLFPPGPPPLHPNIGTGPGQINFRGLMTSPSLGYDPDDNSTDTTTPQGIGNVVAAAVLNYRHHDGSNQLGDEQNGIPDTNKRYTDYTGYTPANQWNNVPYVWRWQPLCTLTAAGIANPVPQPPIRDPNLTCPDNSNPPSGPNPPNYALQKPLGPHWQKVKMFGLLPASQFEVTGPPKNPDGSYSTVDIDKELVFSADLTDSQKAIAEYWADGPFSVFPPGHDFIFAQALSRRRGLNVAASLDADVKTFFMLGNAMMDASIACWYQKYKYDFVRPVTAIRYHPSYTNRMVNSWLGPNQDYGMVPGSQWMPYQQLNVVTPPFPEYPSGHSTFSGAGATILANSFGEAFGAYVVIPANSSAFESNTPGQPVTLSWPTFTHASNEAGDSRRWGGIHFVTGDNHGRALGRQVAQYVYSRAKSYINGTVPG